MLLCFSLLSFCCLVWFDVKFSIQPWNSNLVFHVRKGNCWYLSHLKTLNRHLRVCVSLTREPYKCFSSVAFRSQFVLVWSDRGIHLPHRGGRERGGSVWGSEGGGTAGLLLSGLKSLGASDTQTALCSARQESEVDVTVSCAFPVSGASEGEVPSSQSDTLPGTTARTSSRHLWNRGGWWSSVLTRRGPERKSVFSSF